MWIARCHKMDMINNYYSDIEICLIIIGELERDFEMAEKIFLQGKFLYYEIDRVI